MTDLMQTTVADLVVFEINFNDGHPHKHLIRRADVDKMLQATLELHGGDHPRATKAYAIRTYDLQPETYWWSTPGLGDNDDPNGAIVFADYFNSKILWTSAEYDRDADREMEMEAAIS